MQALSQNMNLLKQDTYRKAGATKADIQRIAQLESEGKTVEQISVIVNVQEAVVQRFMQPVAPSMAAEEIVEPAAPAEAKREPVRTVQPKSGFDFLKKKKKR